MTPERWRRARELFEEALDRNPPDLAAWVNAHTSDADIRAEVLSLADHHSRAGSFLEPQEPT